MHSAILLTFIKLPFVIKIFVLSILSGRFTQGLLYLLFKAIMAKKHSVLDSLFHDSQCALLDSCLPAI